MEEDSQYLFVYGTLRDPSVNHKAHYLKQNATLIGGAEIQAKLYKVSWYPAIVLSESPSDKVYGEIYKLDEQNKEVVLHEIDGYEGIYDSNDDSEEYERVITTAQSLDGKSFKCWVYNYKASIGKAQQITPGDYIKFLESKRN